MAGMAAPGRPRCDPNASVLRGAEGPAPSSGPAYTDSHAHKRATPPITGLLPLPRHRVLPATPRNAFSPASRLALLRSDT